MSIVKTVAPIAIEELKKYFEDKSTQYVIDYENSELQGEQLLVYLGNLELPCNVEFSTREGLDELTTAYLNTTHIVDIEILEYRVIDLLLQFKMMRPGYDQEYIHNNKVALMSWAKKLDSLSLYNMHAIDSDEIKEFVESHPTDDTKDLHGVNFISLLKHQEFYQFYEVINEDNLTYYSSYFTEYMFKGRNMYSYWANENNPMFLLTYGIATGIVKPDEYVEAKRNAIQEL